MFPSNPNAIAVLNALRANVESKQAGWGQVYLDNAVPPGMSKHVFRSALAQLSAFDLYKVVDGFAWGDVKLAEIV